MARPTDPAVTDGGAPDPDADDLDQLSYRDAVEELETILAQLEDDEVDIDQLSRRVRRAAALIRLCQDRIAGARLEVEHVVADLALATGRGRPDDDAGSAGDDDTVDPVEPVDPDDDDDPGGRET